jgi:hypothetical protein
MVSSAHVTRTDIAASNGVIDVLREGRSRMPVSA